MIRFIEFTVRSGIACTSHKIATATKDQDVEGTHRGVITHQVEGEACACVLLRLISNLHFTRAPVSEEILPTDVQRVRKA